MRRHPEAILCVLLALVLVSFPRCAEASEEVFGRDKRQHLAAGLGVGALVFVATPMVVPNAPDWMPFAAGASASLIAALAKEAYDATGRGRVELWDVAWTLAGGLAGVILSDFIVNRMGPLLKGDLYGAFGIGGAF